MFEGIFLGASGMLMLTFWLLFALIIIFGALLTRKKFG
jgi:hypothetical protein